MNYFSIKKFRRHALGRLAFLASYFLVNEKQKFLGIFAKTSFKVAKLRLFWF
jgi:hypothetical protein